MDPKPDATPFAPLAHGGDLAAARALFPDAPEPFIDLSTGINPHPYPSPRFPEECLARLPDAAGLQRLCQAAATWVALSMIEIFGRHRQLRVKA